MSVTIGLVGQDKGVRVDRRSPLGNPFYDRAVDKWQVDCDAYRVWLAAALRTEDLVDVDAIQSGAYDEGEGGWYRGRGLGISRKKKVSSARFSVHFSIYDKSANFRNSR